jgi:EAL domain-containing protein (putative c-di-GMP-specific phosphodiesterase class I)
VVAEGVETLKQFDCLKMFDCDEIQGFLISPPLPVEQIEAMMKNKNFVNEQLTDVRQKLEFELSE